MPASTAPMMAVVVWSVSPRTGASSRTPRISSTKHGAGGQEGQAGRGLGAAAACVRSEAVQAAYRLAARALALAASTSRSLGGALVTRLVQQLTRDRGDLLDGPVEGLGVGLRGLGRPADLAHVLQRGGLDLVLGRGWLEVVECSDVAAHALIVRCRRGHARGLSPGHERRRPPDHQRRPARGVRAHRIRGRGRVPGQRQRGLRGGRRRPHRDDRRGPGVRARLRGAHLRPHGRGDARPGRGGAVRRQDPGGVEGQAAGGLPARAPAGVGPGPGHRAPTGSPSGPAPSSTGCPPAA